ncbi:DEAD/DEAH box helicase [Legionella septentrionalis]|uniref:DEAD/DEAH box helicase n=1 Tax=Legionella septentrionalis TaxID=2498109 RepID=UPI000F8F4DA0|nr:DEAD/DEAH box helicase [Legionella septentrionalis]RUQ92895.1 DEAD/DEAH box helicase [Legionella septentrionalis]
MAFKKLSPKTIIPDSPDILFRELPRRKFPDVLPHQKEMMLTYTKEFTENSDVALQLPTGSGKTLVGLLIGEWRRRKFKEKIVYLCPTKQLVHQAVAQAETKYGLSVIGFTGPKKNYTAANKAKYKQADAIAITTYSSLFNSNPYFNDADVIIIDDAHASENYVSEMWTLTINQFEQSHKQLYDLLLPILGRHLDPLSFSKISGGIKTPYDLAFVEKLPTPELIKVYKEITEVLDLHATDIDLKYPWSVIRDQLISCHIYLTFSEIVIRPMIVPTWTLAAFNNAKQRIYMSATLGEGGDLERLMGKKSIARLSIPSGWDMQGVGRRFFMFPSLSLEPEQQVHLRRELLKKSPRSLILVPSQEIENELSQDIVDFTGLTVFSAKDIEESKNEFINSNGAVAVVANRYDGIDFPGDECRLLFIEGMPKGINAQERFFMNRLGAHILFNERIQTRVLQAIGRCTRSLEDYSAVVISGEELTDYLSNITKRSPFHPELQAEIWFGFEQSKDAKQSTYLENFNIFIKNDDEWEAVNQDIVEHRNTLSQASFPAINQLSKSVQYEIEYQQAMWNKDYLEALSKAESVLSCLDDPTLRGYRALWEYLAGSAASLAVSIGRQELQIKEADHFKRAKNAVNTTVPWLVRLSDNGFNSTQDHENNKDQDELVIQQVENLENYINSLGTSHDRKFSQNEKFILDGITTSTDFELAHKLLGEHLGFSAGKIESEGSPDPWWQIGYICLVFEDHANANPTSRLDTTKARQVASHPKWMRSNVDSCKQSEVQIIPILVTPVSKALDGAKPQLKDVYLWCKPSFFSAKLN